MKEGYHTYKGDRAKAYEDRELRGKLRLCGECSKHLYGPLRVSYVSHFLIPCCLTDVTYQSRNVIGCHLIPSDERTKD